MISETGRVLAVDKDALWVETIRQSTCQSCSARKACGHGILADLGGGNRLQVRVLPGRFKLENFTVGDPVVITVPERVVVQGAFTVYLLPLVTMLSGAVLGGRWADSIGEDLAALLGAALGFGVGVLTVRYLSWSQRNDKSLQPVIESHGKSSAPA